MFTDAVCAIGCSGNFTFEQLLSRYSQAREIHSNDVSLYTCAAGAWLTDKPIDMEIADPDFEWLQPYFQDPLSRVASIVLLLEYLKYNAGKGAYHARMVEHYDNHWEEYFVATCAHLGEAQENLRVTEFHPCDVFDFYKGLDSPDTIFMSFMPTYRGGYERLYKRLGEIIKWTPPQYKMLDDEGRDAIYDFLTQRRFVIYDDRELDLPLVFHERRGGAGRDVFMYSNLDAPPAMVKKHRTIKQGRYKFIGPEDKITRKTRFDFLEVKNEVVNYYREMFLAKNIAYSDGQLPLLMFADGKLFGFAIFTLAKFGAAKDGCIYILSDFVVPYSGYKRLSKLILFLLTSKPIQTILQEKFWMRVKSLHTTAFTDKPASAKYRGVFTLEKRGEGFLNYRAEAGSRTIKGALNEWLNKYSKH